MYSNIWNFHKYVHSQIFTMITLKVLVIYVHNKDCFWNTCWPVHLEIYHLFLYIYNIFVNLYKNKWYKFLTHFLVDMQPIYYNDKYMCCKTSKKDNNRGYEIATFYISILCQFLTIICKFYFCKKKEKNY